LKRGRDSDRTQISTFHHHWSCNTSILGFAGYRSAKVPAPKVLARSPKIF
jgi:hypothetical protein